MKTLLFDIQSINELAIQVMTAVLDKNEEVSYIIEDDSGPVALASALSDFFEITAVIESGQQELDHEQMSELADYGLHLLDGLSHMVRRLELMDHREHQARLFTSIALWMARNEATLDNLEGVADSFAMLANKLSDNQALADLCGMMGEVIDAISDAHRVEQDSSNPSRPWRVLNLNAGIAATRSLDPILMEQTYEKIGSRLPEDIAGFLADGKRQMAVQNVPDEVVAVLDKYIQKWSGH